MRRGASIDSKWKSVILFAALLVGAAASSVTTASGCGPNDIIIHDCLDSGAPDGGGGAGGGGGFSGTHCK